MSSSSVRKSGRGRKSVLEVPTRTSLKEKAVRKSESEKTAKGTERNRATSAKFPPQTQDNYNLRTRNISESKHDDANAKRVEHLNKNRQIARECRERKKLRHDYLESLVDNAELKNKALRKEIKQLKTWAIEMDQGEVSPNFVEYRALWDCDFQRDGYLWGAIVQNSSETQLSTTENSDSENTDGIPNQLSFQGFEFPGTQPADIRDSVFYDLPSVENRPYQNNVAHVDIHSAAGWNPTNAQVHYSEGKFTYVDVPVTGEFYDMVSPYDSSDEKCLAVNPQDIIPNFE